MSTPPDERPEPPAARSGRRLEPYIGISLVIISLALLVLSVAISYSLMRRAAPSAGPAPVAPAASDAPPTALAAAPRASEPAAPPASATPALAATTGAPATPALAGPSASATPALAATTGAPAIQLPASTAAATEPLASPAPSAAGLLGTAEPVAIPCGRGIVLDVEALNLRSEPALGAPILTAVRQFEAVEVLCVTPVEADERVWRQVRYNGLEGWMSDRFLDIQVGAAPVPEAVSTAPVPAAVPTMAAPAARQTVEPPTQGEAMVYVFPVRAASISYEAYHHDYPAADIFVPIGSEFVAPTGGWVEYINRLDRWDPASDIAADRGGIMLAMVGDDNVRYYGSHLLAIADGIEVGVRVEAGQVLGYTGASGNAYNTPPHLHFGISRPTTPDDWRTRRGELAPFPYLKAWERGEMLTPDLSSLGP
jgi:uncharacterized protein YraI